MKEVWIEIRVRPDRNEEIQIPINLYKMLSCTSEGVKMIEELKQIDEMKIKLQDPNEDSNTKRSILWVLAFIGSSEDGFLLLEKHSLIPIIISVA